MRFAAIADVHGNFLALEAVLADIATLGINDIVNLGDLLSGPLEARRTADLLMGLALPTIRGNHDRQIADLPPQEMGLSDRHAFNQLDRSHLAWLAKLPAKLVYRDDVFMCHGTPNSDTTYWLESLSPGAIVHKATVENIEREAVGIGQSLILCAHTHIPRMVRLRDGRRIINPGSVGCPGYDDDLPIRHVVEAGHPDANYAVLERKANRWHVEFRCVPYDHMAAAALAAGNGRAEWASALATGWIR